MQPYQQRVVEEKDALDAKMNALEAFIENSPMFMKASSEEQDRLERQLRIMGQYSYILAERIMNFKE